MRKSGENNVKFSERNCDRSTNTNDFTLGGESQSTRYTGSGTVWISVVVQCEFRRAGIALRPVGNLWAWQKRLRQVSL
jgi:hypothetical protein